MAKRITTTGQMRERVQILSVTEDPFGKHSINRQYSLVEERWARKREASPIAQRNGIGQDESLSHIFVVRVGCTATTENFLQHDGQIFYIRRMRERGANTEDPRERFIELYCELDEDAGSFDNPSPEDS